MSDTKIDLGDIEDIMKVVMSSTDINLSSVSVKVISEIAFLISDIINKVELLVSKPMAPKYDNKSTPPSDNPIN